jgi:hypothetical protein
MQGDDPQFLEAVRLARKFFPESKGYIFDETGMDWDSFGLAMQTADYQADYSCDPFRHPTSPDLGLLKKGGLDGDEAEVYQRLLEHTGFTPQGRALIVFDAIGLEGWSLDACLPIACHSSTVPERLKDQNCFKQGHREMIFIYESGEAILIDHDNRVHWAKSRIRN